MKLLELGKTNIIIIFVILCERNGISEDKTEKKPNRSMMHSVLKRIRCHKNFIKGDFDNFFCMRKKMKKLGFLL